MDVAVFEELPRAHDILLVVAFEIREFLVDNLHSLAERRYFKLVVVVCVDLRSEVAIDELGEE